MSLQLDFDYSLRMIVIGDARVGKTSLIERFTGSGRRVKMRPGAGKESGKRLLERNEKKVLINVRDTAGQERFRSLTASYYRDAHGCLILFDVTNSSTFQNVLNWYKDLTEYSQPNIKSILVGMKCHAEEREVPTERAEKLAENIGLPYVEVSCEKNVNVMNVFEKLADMIIETFKKNMACYEVQHTSLHQQPMAKKWNWCSC